VQPETVAVTITVAPALTAVGVAEMVTDVHGENTVIAVDVTASYAAVLPASRTWTPR